MASSQDRYSCFCLFGANSKLDPFKLVWAHCIWFIRMGIAEGDSNTMVVDRCNYLFHPLWDEVHDWPFKMWTFIEKVFFDLQNSSWQIWRGNCPNLLGKKMRSRCRWLAHREVPKTSRPCSAPLAPRWKQICLSGIVSNVLFANSHYDQSIVWGGPTICILIG